MRVSNIVYKIDQISIQNIFLLDNKKNIIMDGKFTKIIYSDDLFITNGIFIHAPFMLENFSIKTEYNISNTIIDNTSTISSSLYNKCFLLFKTVDLNNEKIIRDLIRIEYCILEFYKQIFKCGKKITTILKSQLHNGCIKTYIDTNEYDKLSKIQFPTKQNFILKISGIWEDYNSIGLTYKFIV